MDETQYDELATVAKRMRDMLVYDMKGPMSSLITSTYILEEIVKQMNCSQEDTENLSLIANMMRSTSEQLLNSFNNLSEELEVIANKDKK